ncbi:hypothetical protein TNCV_2748481 [Trichonephila clavipes]|nr:hypothetical protein TNCV_2748481 [Trichonephila clavipes]
MMDRISVCEALAKRNEIDPFLKRMVTGDEKGSHTTILCVNDHGQSAVKHLKRWPNQNKRPGKFYCVFGETGKESFIRRCFRMTKH